jgi:hypothetical protein
MGLTRNTQIVVVAAVAAAIISFVTALFVVVMIAQWCINLLSAVMNITSYIAV